MGFTFKNYSYKFPSAPSIHEEFYIARGRAIQLYSQVEQSLLLLYAALMGTSAALAGVSFVRINNSRAREAILDRLLKKRHGATYNLFWNSFTKWLRTIDSQRNNVVHWAQVTHIAESVSILLVPPNYWDQDENTPKMGINEILEFSEKCDFASRLIGVFLQELKDYSDGPENKPAWHGIFLQPLTYPLPAGHPLGPSSTGPAPQPKASQA